MRLKPLGDRLIVRAIGEEETSASGIVLSATAKEKPQKGRVLAVGEGKIDETTGKLKPLDVAEGDEVLYSKYGGTEIKVDSENLLMLREEDVLLAVGEGPRRSRATRTSRGSAPNIRGLRKGVEEDLRRLDELAK